MIENNSEIIIYQSENNEPILQVRLENETVWLTQEQIATLFGKAKSTVNEHIKNIYKERELEEGETIQKFGNSEFQHKAAIKKAKNEYDKYRRAEDKKYISDFDREIKKLLKKMTKTHNKSLHLTAIPLTLQNAAELSVMCAKPTAVET